MRISDIIAEFIKETLSAGGGAAELQRNDLAGRFNCVPSQINYVIATRFSPEHGYVVESRRGGGGYIRIERINTDRPSAIMHTVNAIGDALDLRSAAVILGNLEQSGALDPAQANLILAAVGNNALVPVPAEMRGKLRARIFKICLLTAAERL